MLNKDSIVKPETDTSSFSSSFDDFLHRVVCTREEEDVFTFVSYSHKTKCSTKRIPHIS